MNIGSGNTFNINGFAHDHIGETLRNSAIIATGVLSLAANGDVDDYVEISTTTGVTTIDFVGNYGKITNLRNPVNDYDAVNLRYLLDSQNISLHYYLQGSNIMSQLAIQSEASDSETITTSPDTMTNLFYKSTVEDTPAPFEVDAATIIIIHTKMNVDSVVGHKTFKVSFQLGCVDADGVSNFSQIGNVSDTTPTLTTTPTIYNLHLHVPNTHVIVAGKRLWLKVIATVVNNTPPQYPDLVLYRDDPTEHLTIPVAGSILDNFLKNVEEDPSPTLGGELDADSNKIVNLTDPGAAQDAATQNYVDNYAATIAHLHDTQTLEHDNQTSSTSATFNFRNTGNFKFLPNPGNLDAIEFILGGSNIRFDCYSPNVLRGLAFRATKSINFMPDADTDDYIRFTTATNVPEMTFVGGDGKITNVVDPTANQDASTKKYHDDNKTVAGDLSHNSLADLNAGDVYEHISAAQLAALHAIYTDAEAVTAMGVKGDANDLNHDRYTDGEVDSIVATHTADDDAHHAVFTELSEDTTPQLGGDLDLNKKVILIEDDLANGEYEGVVLEIATAGLSYGEVAYIDGNNSTNLADADAVGTMPGIGVYVAAGKILTHGVICDTGWSFTANDQIYVDVDGTLTATAPVASADFVQKMGVALSATEVFINPSLDLLLLG